MVMIAGGNHSMRKYESKDLRTDYLRKRIDGA